MGSGKWYSPKHSVKLCRYFYYHLHNAYIICRSDLHIDLHIYGGFSIWVLDFCYVYSLNLKQSIDPVD